MTDAPLAPGELAGLDQALRGRNQQLDALIAVYREAIPDFPLPEVATATVAAAVGDRFSRGELADLLACAVARIAREHAHPEVTT